MISNTYLINTAGEIVLSIFAVLVVGGLGYLLFLSWNKERIRIRQERANYIEGLKTKADVENDIIQYISHFGTSGSFTLLSIEIEGLRDVEAAFGAKEVEKIIIKTAYKILESLPNSAELTRIKENNFLAYIKNENDQSLIFDITNGIISIIEQPITIMGHASIELSSNIGIVMYPVHASSYKELQKNLNLALYMSKREGKNHFSIYSTDSNAELGNLEYYQQILEGIKNKQFCLHYQPIVNIETNQIYAFEGLLRWNHPVLGVIPPNKFLSIIDQSGDIKYIGMWSFEEMVKEHYEIIKNFPDSHIMFNLNLSPKQLLDENLFLEITRILKKYKADPTYFCFEIIEYAVYEKHQIVNLNIKKLKEMGFKVATDNYGVDYGILNKIRQMPVDIIKLDKDFLIDDESSLNTQLVELLMKLCDESNKTVIALGIENQEMVEIVRNLGIKLVQGYYYSAPLSQDKIVEYIEFTNDVAKNANSESASNYGQTPVQEVVEEQVKTEQIEIQTSSEEKPRD